MFSMKMSDASLINQAGNQVAVRIARRVNRLADFACVEAVLVLY